MNTLALFNFQIFPLIRILSLTLTLCFCCLFYFFYILKYIVQSEQLKEVVLMVTIFIQMPLFLIQYFSFAVHLVSTWRRVCSALTRSVLRTLIQALTYTNPQVPAPQARSTPTPGAIRKSQETLVSMEKITATTPSCIPVLQQVHINNF